MFRAMTNTLIDDYNPGIIGVLLDLTPQLADVNAQVFSMVRIHETPHMGQYCLMGEHAVRVRRQVCQLLEFGGG